MILKISKQTTRQAIKNLILLALTLPLFFTSCQKEGSINLEENSNLKQEKISIATERLKTILKEKKLASKFTTLTPHSAKHTHSTTKERSSIGASKLLSEIAKHETFECYNSFLTQAINPDDYECDLTTLDEYRASLIKEFTEDEFFLISNFGSIAFLEGVFFDSKNDKDYFGVDGQFTSSMQKTFVDLKVFWDIPTDIQLSDAHGATFKNVPIVAAIIELAFNNFDEEGNPSPVPHDQAVEIAELLKTAFSAPVFQDYNHPLFTFNALASPGIPGLGIGPKIVMGDGIMEVYAKLGFRTTADRLILAHEYGHQIQYANEYITEAPSPEVTRRIELMADTYAAYFLAHGQGAFIQPLITKRFVKTAFSIGDCGFDRNGHHGTPNQRGKAADLGSKLAKRRGLVDKKYSSQEIFELFEAELPNLIAPDAE
jgi:hypothetical protein